VRVPGTVVVGWFLVIEVPENQLLPLVLSLSFGEQGIDLRLKH
jgi:hypothetical protein